MVFRGDRPLVGALAAAVLAGVAPGGALANPQGGTVVSGGASIGPAGNSLTVKQTTNRAIINWKSFSVGPGQSTRFVQPSVSAAILNRVTGGDPSVLLGRLQSNGQVYLINPNGIMVGPNGVVDTRGGFVASTLDVPNAAFQQGGSLTFAGGSTAAITNLGTIKTTSGDVALIALHVTNGGTILAPNGEALLASGNEVLYVPDGDSNVMIKPAQIPGGASLDNAGRIAAASAQLKAAGSAYALAVNNTGAIEATGMSTAGGRLVLDGGGGDVQAGGTLTAPGGAATVTGGRVAVTGSVDVSSAAGGGSIAIQGTNAAAVTRTGSLAANATQRGNGGHISVKSQGATNFAGTASATGGPQGGNGGTAEISGATLGVTGKVRLAAPRGKAGSLLLDPTDMDVEPGTADPGDIAGGIWAFAQDSGSQTIGADTIVALVQSGNLKLQATNSITVNGAINAASANTLEFDSPTITVNQPIGISGGTLVFSGINGSQPVTAGQTLGTVASATLSAATVEVNSFAAVTLGGPVQATQLTLDNPFGLLSGPVSITATNAGNAVGTLNVNDLHLSGALDFTTSGALAVGGQGNAGSMAITAAGDLTMSAQLGVQLTGNNNGPITLASTGGAFINQVGTTLFFTPATGRVVIYSATDGGAYSQGGLGFPEYNPVAFGSDPVSGNVVYIASSSALPVLPITADSLSRTYGGTGPSFTFNGGNTSLASLAIQPQLALLQGATPVTNASGLAAGTYTIAPSGAISSQNALSFVNGTFTVNPAPLTITANDAGRLYGASNPAFSASDSGFVNGETSAVVSGLQLATSATSASNAGTYAITPSGAAAANYAISYVNGTLTVNPAPLTITADDTSKTYGAANPGFSASYSGFVNGDTATVVSGLQLATAATSASNVGAYAIVPSGATAANYDITYANGTLTVNPAPLLITANDASRVYGSSNPSFSASYGGLVNGDTSNVVSGLIFATAPGSADVGTYPLVPSGASAGNYAISYQNGTLTVNPAPLSIVANSFSRPFGEANPPLTAGIFGLTNGDTAAVVTGMQLNTSATPSSNVGTYPIVPSGASAANYVISYTNGTLTVGTAANNLIVTANDAMRLYGAGNPSFSASITGFVNGDNASVVSGLTFSTPAITASNVGTYPIVPGGATATNYNISFVAGTLTVQPAPLLITANNASRLYGAGNPTFSAGYSGFVNGDTPNVVSAVTYTSAPGTANVGTYAIVPSGASATNYSISYQNGTLTVNPAPLTITANDANRLYGTSNPAFGASYGGLVNGDTAAVVSGLQFGTSATAGSNVGAYPITPSGASAANYAISYQNGTLTVNPAPLTITANDSLKTYGAANPAFSASYSGLVNGDTSAVVTGLQFATTATVASTVGTYPIVPSGGTAANYAISYADGTLTVQPAPLLITANDANRLYGASNPAFSASYGGLVNGDTPAVVFGLALSSAPSSANAGTYVIVPSGASATNYAISYQSGTLTVNPAPLTITANDASRLYGAGNPGFAASYDGLVNGDTSSVVSGLTLSSAPASANAGTYPIVPAGASASNYAIGYRNGTLTVNPAPLTITASDASRLYGAGNPIFGASYSGLVNSDTAAVVSGLQLGTTATAASNVGTYPITAAGAAATNYAITYAPGTLTVNPAALTITANDASAVYAQSFPAFTASYSGLVNGDTAAAVSGLQFVENGIQGSPAGTYAIIPFGATASNYAIAFVNGTLRITPAPLTITANDAARLYGAGNPAFTASYSGLVNGDNPSVVGGLQLSTAATSTSNVGAYPIVPSGASAANYSIAYAPGTLTVNPAPLTITANNAAAVYGAAIPAFGAGYSGFVNGDTSSVVSGLTLSPPPSPANAGTYAIVPSGATAANYAISYRNGTLTITPASLTIVPTGEQTYGGSPTVTYAYSGFANGDSAASLTKPPVFATPAGQFDSVNFYPLFASGAASPNYAINYLPGTLRITPATLFVTPADVTRLYGAAVTPDSVSFSGFVNGDTASTVFSTLPTANSLLPSLNVGKYALPVYQGGVIKNPNYVESDLSGTLTVTPAPLTITGLNASGFQGQPLPSLTGQFDGLVAGDTPQTVPFTFGAIVVPGSAVTSSSPSGSYQTVLVGNDPNYNVTFVPGTLNLNPAPITITTKLTPITLTTAETTYTPDDITVYTTDPLGFAPGGGSANLLAYQEEQSVIDQFLAATGDNLADLELALKNPDSAAVTLGNLTPFLYADLQNILNIDQSQWTAQQAAFVQAFQNYIQAQKEAAANQAMADYQSWKEQQTAIYNAKVSALSGVAQMEEMAILSSDPPIPPTDFLNEAQSGMNLSNVDVLNVSIIAGQTAQISQAAVSSQHDMSAAAIDFLLKNTDPSNQKVYNQLKTELNSKDTDVQASAEQYILQEYQALVEVGQAPEMPPGYDVPSPQSANGFIGGAIGDATMIVSKAILAGTSTVLTVAESKGVTTKTLDLNTVGKDASVAQKTANLDKARLPRFEKQLQTAIDALQKALDDPDLTEIKAQIKQSWTRPDGTQVLSDYEIDQRAQAKVADMKAEVDNLKLKVENLGGEAKGIEGVEGAIKETELVNDMLKASKTLQNLAKGAEALGAVTGPVGAIIEVAANVAQIITGGVEYGTLDTYNTAFNNAVKAAKNPVSVNDLKAMLNSGDGKTQMLNYFQTMMATGGQANSATPTMSLSQIEAH